MIVRRGEHLLRHMSCLQTLVALSSGEAEYYVLIRGTCTSLGIQSHDQDWMIDVPIQIYSDSSAARSVARRRGIGGRLRHLQTRHVWLQSRVALGHLKLDVVAGEQNPADTLNETIARTQNPRVVGTCWSEMVAAITTTNDGEHRDGCLVTNILMPLQHSAAADRPGSLESFH